MTQGRRASDWLIEGPARAAEGADRRSSDRRGADRRAPRRRIDPLFAATLLNQILPAATEPAAYRTARAPAAAGRLTDVRA